jgi:hypothetical protein
MMVSAANGGPELFAIDATAVLGAFDPSEVMKSGSGSKTMQGGLFNTKNEMTKVGDERVGPGALLDAFFKSLINQVRAGTKALGGHRGGAPTGPGDILQTTYFGNRSRYLASFEEGWNEGLIRIHNLVSTSEGRQQMRGLFAGLEGGDDLRKTTLKTNAMYLAGLATGKSHEEAAVEPGVYAARKWAQELKATDLVLPADEFHWNQARVPHGALSADLDDLPSLVGAKDIRSVYGAEKWTSYNVQMFDKLAASIRAAKTEAEQFGSKRRFGRGEVTRNRTVAGRFLAESQAAAIGAIRAGAIAGRSVFLFQQVQVALSGKMSPNQATAMLQNLSFARTTSRPMQTQLRQFASTLSDAGAGVGKMKRFKWRETTAQALVDAASFAGEAGERLDKGVAAYDPAPLEQLLEAAAAQT